MQKIILAEIKIDRPVIILLSIYRVKRIEENIRINHLGFGVVFL